jgi:hypothetical protein
MVDISTPVAPGKIEVGVVPLFYSGGRLGAYPADAVSRIVIRLPARLPGPLLEMVVGPRLRCWGKLGEAPEAP